MSVISSILSEVRATKIVGGNPQSPQYWLSKLFGGTTDTAAGIAVDEDSALKFSPVWNAVNIISGAVGFLPLVVFHRLANGGKERATSSRIYELLHDRPNEFMDALVFKETLQAHALTWGNGYAEIEFDNAGRPLALWPLLPNRMEPKIVDGKLVYRYRQDTGKEIILPHWAVLHIKGLGFDGLKGYSVIRYAAEGLAAGIAAEKFGARFFGNGAQPGGVLQHPGALSDEAHQRLRQAWADMHGGIDNAQRIAILEEGMKYEKIGIPPEDAQFLQTRQFSVSDVARWFDIPPHMLKELGRATFSNIEHQGIEFVTWTLMKWLRRWELECSWKLFGVATYATYFAEFIPAALLRGDTKSRYEAYQLGINAGWLARNEVRILENMNPQDGLDEFLEPLNLTKAGGGAERAARSREDCAALLRDTCERIVTKETNAIRRFVNKPEEFGARIEDFLAKHETFVADVLSPVLQALCGSKDKAPGAACAHVKELREALQAEAGRECALNAWQSNRADEMTDKLLKIAEV